MERVNFLLKKGWIVFPCEYGGKAPLTTHGFKDATKDLDVIKGWLKKWPNCNIAIPTGKINNITVCDVDPRYGGHISLERFDVPSTLYSQTGQGGKHLFFQYTPKAKNGSGVIAPGIDVKNDGGYVIVPPSILIAEKGYNVVNGGKYEWCDDHLSLAKAPEWLWSNAFEKEIKDFKLSDGPIPIGQQDDTLFRLVCSLKHKKFTPGWIHTVIKAIINDPLKCQQDPNNPFTDKDIERWIKGAFKYEDNDKDNKKPVDPILFLDPTSANDFKLRDIPEISYYVDGLVQKKGRTMISAKANMGKSFFLLNMLVSLCKGEDKFINKFYNEKIPPIALYIDLEMGESALQERLKTMGTATDLKNLYVQCMYGWDMLNEEYKTALEDIIVSKKINIIAFDPLGSLWNGDENKRESVKQLTDYFDYLLDKYGISVILTHHWRKSTKDSKDGAEMAAGSYGWNKWLDNHITIQGEPTSMVISCDKSRNQERWAQFRLKLNKENLTLEFIGDFKNNTKFTDEDMLGIFNSFKQEKVNLPDFVRKGKGVCSRTTLYRLLDDSKYLAVNKEDKPFYIYRKNSQPDFVDWRSEKDD